MGDSSQVQNGTAKDDKPVYPFPNQAKEETQRLDGQHEVFRLRLGALYKAHLSCKAAPLRVLDLGCGTGIWCREFAAAHPSAQVLGIDVLPPAERGIDSATPSNCTFIKANFEHAWTFAEGQEHFDFIYARMLIAGVRDWPGLFRQCLSHLRPGGLIEVFEGKFELRAEDSKGLEESPAIRWFGFAQDYLTGNGLKWDRAMDLPHQLRNVGFNIVEDLPVKMKLYPDESDPEKDRVRIADRYLNDMTGIVGNMTERMFGDASAKLTLEEGRVLAEEAKREMVENRERRGYHTTLYVRVAQKPAESAKLPN